MSFGKKYVVFCGSTSPRRARSNTASIGAGRTSSAASASPRSTAASASSRRGVYETPSGRRPLDELDVQAVALDEPVAAAAVDDDAGQPVRGPLDLGAVDVADALGDPVRREDRQALLARRHEHDHHPRGGLRAVLVVKRERRLVPVVAVGDQELLRELGQRVDPPEALAVEREIGLAVRQLDRVAVVQQEDRLELRPRRAQQAQALLLDVRVRPLVREHDPSLVRLEPERDDHAVPRARHAVGADVRLRERPVRGLVVGGEDLLLAPRGEVARGLLLRVRQRQVDDVVGAAREVLPPLVRADDVVRRSDEILERPGALGVPLGAEGTHVGHRWTVP